MSSANKVQVIVELHPDDAVDGMHAASCCLLLFEVALELRSALSACRSRAFAT